MPRKGPVQKRLVANDPVYGSLLVSQLANKVLSDDRKPTTERIVYGAPELCEEKTSTDPVLIPKCAIENVEPAPEVRSRRVGGVAYQVPAEVRSGRDTALVLRWPLMSSRQRRENTMTERLANEILDASNGLDVSVKRREGTHKMAEANRAFAHCRW